MIEIIINKNDEGQRVDKFLGKVTQNCSKSMIYKWIRLKKIKVNRSRCEIDQKLKIGDIVQFFIPHEFVREKQLDFLNASDLSEIEFENEDFLIVWKEKGVLVHQNNSQDEDTLIQRVLKYLYLKKQYLPEQESSFTPASIHRLDRNTEGYVIFAKNYTSLKELNLLLKEHKIQKKYLALIENKLSQKGQLIHYHYKKENGEVLISNNEKEGYKKIITNYQVLQTKNNINLVEIELITGKSHQIRAQFAHIGNPLLSDMKYGSKVKGNYQELCAYYLEFHYKQSFKFMRKNNLVSQKFDTLSKNNHC